MTAHVPDAPDVDRGAPDDPTNLLTDQDPSLWAAANQRALGKMLTEPHPQRVPPQISRADQEFAAPVSMSGATPALLGDAPGVTTAEPITSNLILQDVINAAGDLVGYSTDTALALLSRPIAEPVDLGDDPLFGVRFVPLDDVEPATDTQVQRAKPIQPIQPIGRKYARRGRERGMPDGTRHHGVSPSRWWWRALKPLRSRRARGLIDKENPE